MHISGSPRSPRIAADILMSHGLVASSSLPLTWCLQVRGSLRHTSSSSVLYSTSASYPTHYTVTAMHFSTAVILGCFLATSSAALPLHDIAEVDARQNIGSGDTGTGTAAGPILGRQITVTGTGTGPIVGRQITITGTGTGPILGRQIVVTGDTGDTIDSRQNIGSGDTGAGTAAGPIVRRQIVVTGDAGDTIDSRQNIGSGNTGNTPVLNRLD
ncbi:hypothetical protein FIBSPDRAFT_590484 [Athelia psychrophila]|uniref:Uncharacterized protein n=1 Tax=Athelia psychrophila TaxID=1759441 RepID=A0A166H9A9_9AGAM|nr:hypothetical protein FIBSPDRAFT_590484 [Fibularhizoctonia sp. CBS 109695]